MLAMILASAIAASSPETAAYAQLSDYRQWPSSYDGYLATPEEVHTRGIGGTAVLLCKVTEIGVLAKCRVHSEDPKGWGFGQAAMALRTKMRMVPAAKGEEKWLLIPFRWAKHGPYLPPQP